MLESKAKKLLLLAAIICSIGLSCQAASMRVAVAVVYVKNHDEAIEWYTQKLGFDLRSDIYSDKGRVVTIAYKNQPNFELALYQGEPLTGKVTIALFTDNIQEKYNALLQKGVRFSHPPKVTPLGIFAILEDLYAQKIVLAQPY